MSRAVIHTSGVCEYVTSGIGSPDCQDDACECECHFDLEDPR